MAFIEGIKIGLLTLIFAVLLNINACICSQKNLEITMVKDTNLPPLPSQLEVVE